MAESPEGDAPLEAAKRVKTAGKRKKSGFSKKTRRASKPPRESDRKARTVRSFPASTFEDALVIAKAIHKFAAGQKIRRLTLFDKLGKSPESGPSRQMIVNSTKYGLTKGGYQAEYLELTPDGRLATDPDAAPGERLGASFRLAVEQIAPFKLLYESNKGSKLPAQDVLRDRLLENGYSKAEVAECVDTFILNAKYLGILSTVAGAERLLPVEHVVEEADNAAPTKRPLELPQQGSTASIETPTKGVAARDWSKVCFYVTPIGDPKSDDRQHADLFLNSIVEPALREFDLELVRADQIGQAGMITRQVIEHVVYARLVIADLSYHNPNVFYELCLRHMCRKPTVQIIRTADKIPFDLDQFRTIQIDTGSIYTLVPQLGTYKSEIANQVRRALEDPDAVDNPISLFFPNFKVTYD